MVPTELEAVSEGWSDEIRLLLTEVRTLARSAEDASARSEGSGVADLAGVANRLLLQLEAFPERIANALSSVLATQHRLIIKDVHVALEEFGARLEPLTPQNKTEA